MEWKEPSGYSRGLAIEAAELRRHPGQWGMITYTDRDKGRKHRERIVSGKASAFRPQGAFEATLRYTKDCCELYLRYIGEEGQYGQSVTDTVDGAGAGPGSGTADPGTDGSAAVDLPGTVAPHRDCDR